MLRRLGLAKESAANGSTGKGGNGKDVVLASAAPFVSQSRFFKVVYAGGVAVRSNPNEPAPENGQVIENCVNKLKFSMVARVDPSVQMVKTGLQVQLAPPSAWVFFRACLSMCPSSCRTPTIESRERQPKRKPRVMALSVTRGERL